MFGRKKFKDSGLYVGDYVDFDETELVINKVFERKNKLIRPPVANVTQVLIVIAPKPKPDFYLVDKIIVKCLSVGIKPILIINKCDILSAKLEQNILEQYTAVCDILILSTRQNVGIDLLKEKLVNNLNVFTGQSAVGKSSIINTLVPNRHSQVGELSKKIERGKNCTRHSEIFNIDDNTQIVDTPGFSVLDMDGIDSKTLCDYYPDFLAFQKDCKYNTCVHIGESETNCAIKRAVSNGQINKQRYSRYCELYQQLKDKEDKLYE